MRREGGHLLALHDDLGFENTRLDGCMDEMRRLVLASST
jgi:hypothetical protein